MLNETFVVIFADLIMIFNILNRKVSKSNQPFYNFLEDYKKS